MVYEGWLGRCGVGVMPDAIDWFLMSIIPSMPLYSISLNPPTSLHPLPLQLTFPYPLPTPNHNKPMAPPSSHSYASALIMLSYSLASHTPIPWHKLPILINDLSSSLSDIISSPYQPDITIDSPQTIYNTNANPDFLFPRSDVPHFTSRTSENPLKLPPLDILSRTTPNPLTQPTEFLPNDYRM